MRREFLKLMIVAGASSLFPARGEAKRKFEALGESKSDLVAMRYSPFPYHGANPETGEPFINVRDGTRMGHQSPRGGINWEDKTYNDKRCLFYLPEGFDLGRPAALVVYFHGNDATLERDVIGRQHIPTQLGQSGINAALAAPQFAVGIRDSSPGNFWRPGYFSSWLAEAGSKLAKLYGAPARAADFNSLPVVLVAYSGGYFPAAWCLKLGGAGKRIAGLVLMDALYGDTEKFASWARMRHKSSFLFSAYTEASKKWNLELEETLEGDGIQFARGLPERLRAGQIHFAEMAEGLDHVEFMSQAWTDDPLRWVLERMPQYRKA